MNIKILHNIYTNRAFHCATNINTKLYIFGGLNDFGYIGVDIEVIELNNKKAIVENNKYF